MRDQLSALWQAGNKEYLLIFICSEWLLSDRQRWKELSFQAITIYDM
jgi:hypothetical protein